ELDRVRIEKWRQRTIELENIYWDEENIKEDNINVKQNKAHEIKNYKKTNRSTNNTFAPTNTQTQLLMQAKITQKI
ncbi:hypothetical protein ACJBYZ_10840, partial [Streptococcus suis]